MVNFSPPTLRKLKFCGICLISLLSITLLGTAAWELSKLLTWPVSLIIILFTLWALVRLVSLTIVFPGSSFFWKRSIENAYCREMTTQFLINIKDLRSFLESLLATSTNQKKIRIMPLTTHLRSILIQIISNLSDLEDNEVISNYQKRLLMLLSELKHLLEEAKMILNSSEDVSVWDWLDASGSHSKPTAIVFEDYPEHLCVHQAISACKRVEAVLAQSCGRQGCFRRLIRWLRDDTLGSLHYMRVDLIKRLNCEQIWVRNEDSTLIDCVLVPSKTSAPCIIMCNPNAGYYEYAYFQNEWVDFYKRLGLNIVLWNYRGYGRTRGSPSMKNLLSDGKAVVDHIKTTMQICRIGVHGESLGGCVATHLAKACNLEFLFADRTFSDIKSTAYFNYGAVASFLLKLTSTCQFTAVKEYLDLNCYKVLSCDYQDTMINDLGSLKSGVAFTLLCESLGLDESVISSTNSIRQIGYILSSDELNEVKEAMGRLAVLVNLVTRSVGNLLNAAIPLFKQDARVYTQYQLIAKETDALDDEDLFNAISKLGNLFEDLDAGGKPLISVLSSPHMYLALLL